MAEPMSDERLAEIRARLDGRRKMREQAQCDASLHLRSGQEWPCLLPWHKGYHVYDVAIDADRDLADLLAEADRLQEAILDAELDAEGWRHEHDDARAEVARLTAENTRLRAVAEWADRALEVIHEDSDSDLDETFVMQGYAAVRARREGE